MIKILRGFTLIELAITMTVIALLIMIVSASFTKQVTKSRRADAKTTLLKLSQEQESYLADNNRYAGMVTQLPSCNRGEPCLSEQQFYNINLGNVTPTAFELQAVPNPEKAQKDDEQCAKFTINQTGRRYAENLRAQETTSDCW